MRRHHKILFAVGGLLMLAAWFSWNYWVTVGNGGIAPQ